MHLRVLAAQLLQLLLPELRHRVHRVCQVAPDVAVTLPPPLLLTHSAHVNDAAQGRLSPPAVSSLVMHGAALLWCFVDQAQQEQAALQCAVIAQL